MRRILNNGVPSKKGITTFTKKMITSLFQFTEGGKCNPDSFVSLRFRLLRLLRPIKERLPDTPGKITALFFDSLADIR